MSNDQAIDDRETGRTPSVAPSTSDCDIDAEWEDELAELSAAEDFLDFFEVEYEQSVIHVNRLHILQRFHNYIVRNESDFPANDHGRWQAYRAQLTRAYQDFVESDAQTEKVFDVFHAQAGTSFVPLTV